MEASEKPKQSLDSAGEGTVRVLEDRIVVEELTIADRDTARVVRERAESGEEPTRTVRRTIEIGARVLDREDSAAEVDFVRREFERMASEHREQVDARNRETTERVEAEIRRAFGAEESGGLLGTALESHSIGLTEQLAELFDDGRDSTVQARIRTMLEQRDQAFLQRLSADDEANPLRPLLTTIKNWARERREDQDTRDEKLEQKVDRLLQEAAALAGLKQGSEDLAAAVEAGTQKGFDFEEAVHEQIERIASARGDAAHHVGSVSNEAGSKKGDTLVEIGGADGPARARIVFEAKDRKLSRNEAWKELDAELEGRDAAFAILIVSGESKLPAKTQELHEYQGNKMVMVFDKESLDPLALELVYRYASARALMASELDLDVDAAGVDALVERAAAALKRGKGVRDCLTRAEQGIDGAREGFDAIVADVESCLDQVQELISPTVESS
ncbi:MAG: hypothetical protein AABM29_10275 [Actinomycetota bacterium]